MKNSKLFILLQKVKNNKMKIMKKVLNECNNFVLTIIECTHVTVGMTISLS